MERFPKVLFARVCVASDEKQKPDAFALNLWGAVFTRCDPGAQARGMRTPAAERGVIWRQRQRLTRTGILCLEQNQNMRRGNKWSATVTRNYRLFFGFDSEEVHTIVDEAFFFEHLHPRGSKMPPRSDFWSNAPMKARTLTLDFRSSFRMEHEVYFARSVPMPIFSLKPGRREYIGPGQWGDVTSSTKREQHWRNRVCLNQ